MTLFSKLLKHYIESSGYTIYQLAKRSGLNRTSIQKAISEDRLPHLDSLRKLEKLLNLTPDEHRLFWEAYERAFYGETLFCQCQSVRRLLISISHSPFYRENTASASVFYPDEFSPASVMPSFSIPERKLYQSLLSFSSFFRSLLEEARQSHVYTLEAPILASFSSMPPSLLFHILFSCLTKEDGSLSMEQIVYFIKNPNTSGQPSYNLDLLSLYLPFFSFCNDRYNAWYSYRENLAAVSYPELFPSYIVFHHQVILFSSDFQRIWVETDPDLISHFRKVFYLAKRSALPLAIRSETLYDLPSYESISPENAVLFNAEGLKDFALSGSFYGTSHPVSLQKRYNCLKYLEKCCLDDSCAVCAIPPSSIPLSPGTSIVLQGAQISIGFPGTKKESWYHISISENTIVDSFRDFIQISLENQAFLSRTETLCLIRNLISSLEACLQS